MLSSVFCSSTSCGWISTLKRRDARKSCSSTLPQRDLLQRPVEDRLADDADLGLELVDARVRRHPARLDVRGRDAVVVAAEEGEEVLREVALVRFRQRAHDAEVERDVLAEVRRVDGDEDVAGVHVGVEEAVAEHLREEELDAGARQLLEVDAGLDQPLDLRDRDAAHPLHHHHFAGAPVPVHLGHAAAAASAAKLRRSCEQLAASRDEVELVAQRLLELGDDLARAQPLAVGPQLLDEHRAGLHQADVVLDHRRRCRDAAP